VVIISLNPLIVSKFVFAYRIDTSQYLNELNINLQAANEVATEIRA
jgi:hypothetical protein